MNKYHNLIFLAVLFFQSIEVFPQESKADKEWAFAEKLYADKIFTLAAEQFKDFAKNFPNNDKADDALFYSGESYVNEKAFKLAFDSYKELEIKYPLSNLIARSRYKLAQCQIFMQNYETAAKLFQRVVIFHPESELAPQALFEAGKALLKSGKNNEALNIYFKLINEFPEYKERILAYHEIIKIYINTGKLDLATQTIEEFFQAFGPDFNDIDFELLRADIFEKLGQSAEAESIYLSLLEIRPPIPNTQTVLYKLGNLYQNRRDFNTALKYFDKYIVNADSSEQTNCVYLKRGDILFAQKQFDAALESYQKALPIIIPQQKIEVEFKIANVLAILEKYQLSANVFTNIMTNKKYADSSDSLVVNYVEKAYWGCLNALIKSNKYKAALNLVEEFSNRFENSPHFAFMQFKKAEIYENNIGNFTKALRIYDEFMDTYPFHPKVDDAQLAIARCYEKLEEYNLAFKEYQNYINRFPAGEEYDRVKTSMRLLVETMIGNKKSNRLTQISRFFDKLAQGQNNVDWNFELGKLFFEQKEFVTAITYFNKAQANLNNKSLKENVYYYLGKSYFKLAEKLNFLDKTHEVSALFDSAATNLNYLNANEGNSERTEEVCFLLSQIELNKIESPADRQSKLFEYKNEWPDRFPANKYFDYILIELANEIMRSNTDRDTSLYQQELEIYRQIQEKYPESVYYERTLYQEAVALHKIGEDSLALVKVTNFLNTQPESHFVPQALFLKAKLAKKNENYKLAIQMLNRIQSDFFYSSQVKKSRLELADIYFQMGDFKSALNYYQFADNYWENDISHNNFAQIEDAKITLKEAEAYENLGKLSEALQRYINFIHENPSHENVQQARFAVARISRKQNNITLAKEYYQSILKHATDTEQKYQSNVALADIYFQQELYQEANTYYLKAIQLAKDVNEEKYPTSQSIRCKYKLKKFKVADSDVKKFKKKFKNTTDDEGQFLLDKGHAHISNKDFKPAEKVFKKLKNDFKNSDFAAQGEFGLGAVYLITNHTDDALKILTNIPSKYPDSEVTPLTYFNLGDFYYKSQQVENAILAFKQILIHPKAGDYQPKAMQYLIKCYTDVKIWDQAIAYTRKYLELYPNAKDRFFFKIELAKFLMNIQEYDRAISHFQRLKPFADDETQAEIQFYIGQCYNEMRNYKRAAIEFLKVKYLTKPTKLPWHVTAQFEASKCLIKSNEIEQGKILLRRIIKEQGTENNFGRFALKKLKELESTDISTVEK